MKITWKSALGALSMVIGIETALIGSLHMPTDVSSAMTIAGAFIVGLERLADSNDFATAMGPGAAAEISKLQAGLASAQADSGKWQTSATNAIRELEAFKGMIASITPNLNASDVPLPPPAVVQPSENPGTVSP